MKWFGPKYDAPICVNIETCETPVGLKCAHCAEPIIDGERGVMLPFSGRLPDLFESQDAHLGYHLECHVCSVVGSVAHQRKQCSCWSPGDEYDPDVPEAFTKREAAKMAAKLAGVVLP